MKLKEKIQKKLDVLEFMMKNNVHLADPDGCMDYSLFVNKRISCTPLSLPILVRLAC